MKAQPQIDSDARYESQTAAFYITERKSGHLWSCSLYSSYFTNKLQNVSGALF